MARHVATLTLLVVAFLGAGSPRAIAAPQCQVMKLRVAGRGAAAELGCEARAAAQGTAANQACVNSTRSGIIGGIARVELKPGCVAGNSDNIPVDDALQAEIPEIAAALRPTGDASGCARKKLLHTARRLRRDTQALARDKLKPDDGALALALAENAERFQAGFAAAERLGDCLTSGDDGALGGLVDRTSGHLVGILFPECGDEFRAGSEACDQGDDDACPGACAADCTCGPAVCGNGVVEGGEGCDGTCGVGGGGYLCEPPGADHECECCASDSPCFIQDAGFFTIPCCGDQVCVIDNLIYPHKVSYCADPCTSHDDCPAGQYCSPAGGCDSFRACTDHSECDAGYGGYCLPIGVCVTCDPLGNCWGPIP